MTEHESWVTVVGTRRGRRYAERKPLNVPVALATGKLEDLSELQLREAVKDLQAEEQRRADERARQAEVAKKCRGFDPFTRLRRAA